MKKGQKVHILSYTLLDLTGIDYPVDMFFKDNIGIVAWVSGAYVGVKSLMDRHVFAFRKEQVRVLEDDGMQSIW